MFFAGSKFGTSRAISPALSQVPNLKVDSVLNCRSTQLLSVKNTSEYRSCPVVSSMEQKETGWTRTEDNWGWKTLHLDRNTHLLQEAKATSQCFATWDCAWATVTRLTMKLSLSMEVMQFPRAVCLVSVCLRVRVSLCPCVRVSVSQ